MPFISFSPSLIAGHPPLPLMWLRHAGDVTDYGKKLTERIHSYTLKFVVRFGNAYEGFGAGSFGTGTFICLIMFRCCLSLTYTLCTLGIINLSGVFSTKRTSGEYPLIHRSGRWMDGNNEAGNLQLWGLRLSGND